jgi:hypothetical protein
MRRSDSVAKFPRCSCQLGSRWPLLPLEETQNFSSSALEEVLVDVRPHRHPATIHFASDLVTTHCCLGCRWVS